MNLKKLEKEIPVWVYQAGIPVSRRREWLRQDVKRIIAYLHLGLSYGKDPFEPIKNFKKKNGKKAFWPGEDAVVYIAKFNHILIEICPSPSPHTFGWRIITCWRQGKNKLILERGKNALWPPDEFLQKFSQSQLGQAKQVSDKWCSDHGLLPIESQAKLAKGIDFMLKLEL